MPRDLPSVCVVAVDKAGWVAGESAPSKFGAKLCGRFCNTGRDRMACKQRHDARSVNRVRGAGAIKKEIYVILHFAFCRPNYNAGSRCLLWLSGEVVGVGRRSVRIPGRIEGQSGGATSRRCGRSITFHELGDLRGERCGGRLAIDWQASPRRPGMSGIARSSIRCDFRRTTPGDCRWRPTALSAASVSTCTSVPGFDHGGGSTSSRESSKEGKRVRNNDAT